MKSVNDPPVFKKIPDQAVEEKNEFTSFILDDYLSDADHDFSKLKVEVTGNKDLKVNIDNRSHEVSVKIPHDQWNGTENLTFTATDPEGARATTSAKFTVKAINDPPVMKDIREQTIKEKGEFQTIELDNFVETLTMPRTVSSGRLRATRNSRWLWMPLVTCALLRRLRSGMVPKP